MTRVRWTTDAAKDLERICDYIAESSPEAACRTAQAIVESVGSLGSFPHRGRLGRVQGTRELVMLPLPYVAGYEVRAEVHVLRVLHGAQHWPTGQ